MDVGSLLLTDSFIGQPITKITQAIEWLQLKEKYDAVNTAVLPVWTTVFRLTRQAVRVLFDFTLWFFKQWLTGTIIYSLGFLLPDSMGFMALKLIFKPFLLGWSWLTADFFFLPGLVATGYIAQALVLPVRDAQQLAADGVDYLIGTPAGWAADQLESSPGLACSVVASAGGLWLCAEPVLEALRVKDLLQGIVDLSAAFGELAVQRLPGSKAIRAFGRTVKFTFSYIGIDASSLLGKEKVSAAVRFAQLEGELDGVFKSLTGDLSTTWQNCCTAVAVLLGGNTIKSVLQGKVNARTGGAARSSATGWLFADKKVTVAPDAGPQNTQGQLTMASILAHVLGLMTPEEFKLRIGGSVENTFASGTVSQLSARVGQAANETIYGSPTELANPAYYWNLIAQQPLASRAWMILQAIAMCCAMVVTHKLGDSMSIVFGLVCACLFVTFGSRAANLVRKAKLDPYAVKNLTIEVRVLESLSIDLEANENVLRTTPLEAEELSMVPAEVQKAFGSGDVATALATMQVWVSSAITKTGELALLCSPSDDTNKNLLALCLRRLNDRRSKLELFANGTAPEKAAGNDRIEKRLGQAVVEASKPETFVAMPRPLGARRPSLTQVAAKQRLAKARKTLARR